MKVIVKNNFWYTGWPLKYTNKLEEGVEETK